MEKRLPTRRAMAGCRDGGDVNEEMGIDGPRHGTGLRARHRVALGPGGGGREVSNPRGRRGGVVAAPRVHVARRPAHVALRPAHAVEELSYAARGLHVALAHQAGRTATVYGL
jgi:hypothetical protein